MSIDLKSSYYADFRQLATKTGSILQKFVVDNFIAPPHPIALSEEWIQKIQANKGEVPDDFPIRTLANGAKISLSAAIANTQGAAAQFPIIFKRSKLVRVKANVFAFDSASVKFNEPIAAKLLLFQMPGVYEVTGMDLFIGEKKNKTILSSIRSALRRNDEDDAKDSNPSTTIDYGFASLSLIPDLVPFEMQFTIKGVPEDVDELEVTVLYQLMPPAAYFQISTVLKKNMTRPEVQNLYNAIREDLVKNKRGHLNVQDAGLMMKGTKHIPIALQRDGTKVIIEADKEYGFVAGVFFEAKDNCKPRLISYRETEIPNYMTSIRSQKYQYFHQGLQMDFHMAHGSPLFIFRQGDKIVFEYEKEEDMPEVTEGFIIVSHLVNLTNQGAVDFSE